MKQRKKSTIVGTAIALVSIWAVTAASLTAVWLTGELRVVGLVTVPPAIVAGLLVVYFEWRVRLQRHILSRGEDVDHFDKAA